VKDCAPGERKHKIGEQHLMGEQHLAGGEVKPGLFPILVAKAPALVWEVKKTAGGKLGSIEARGKQPDGKTRWPFVNHYSFHIWDPEWGHITFKMSGHPPFGVQVMLNGHEFVACQARKEKIDLQKEDNCFTESADAAGLARMADTLSQAGAIGRLSQVCKRWLYTACLVFGLDVEEQNCSGFRYQYSTYQMEYSRNLQFQVGQQMEEVFQALIDRSRPLLHPDRVTIFGAKKRPQHRRRNRNPTLYQRRTRAPHRSDCAQCQRTTRGPFDGAFSEDRSAAERHSGEISQHAVLHRCLLHRRNHVGGINYDEARMRKVIEAVVALATSPTGFSASELAVQVRALSDEAGSPSAHGRLPTT
jgi:hypothetical protein